MLGRGSAPQENPAQAEVIDPTELPSQAASSAATAPSDEEMPANPMDMGEVMQKVKQKTDSVTSQGAEHSMQYIEDEAKRLQDMAKEIDKQYGR
jgi:hypothetical protein